MPLYRCSVPKGSVSLEKRFEIARTVTDIHTGSDGRAAPLSCR